MAVYVFRNGIVIKRYTTGINSQGMFQSETEQKFLYPESMLRDVLKLVYSHSTSYRDYYYTELDIKHYKYKKYEN